MLYWNMKEKQRSHDMPAFSSLSLEGPLKVYKRLAKDNFWNTPFSFLCDEARSPKFLLIKWGPIFVASPDRPQSHGCEGFHLQDSG